MKMKKEKEEENEDAHNQRLPILKQALLHRRQPEHPQEPGRLQAQELQQELEPGLEREQALLPIRFSAGTIWGCTV